MSGHSQERSFLKIRRLLHPAEWSARILGLNKSVGTAASPGLVMVQIDGFSKREFERALERGEMPFLKRLLAKEHYRLYAHYPGLPSSTPSVQGELFYGVPQCIPAFFFYDQSTKKPVALSNGDDVLDIERQLGIQGEALLSGGSSYSNVFSGGAAESHFCACSLGWDRVWKDVNPANVVLLGLTHLGAFLRMTFLTGLELILAAANFVKGVAKGENVYTELKFIPIRAAICVLLRELVTLGARIDIARGLPVVHLNFLGFDELAHRRGPPSAMAHWSLRGIDSCIAKIYRSAVHSTRRHYDVWVYSDHGQETMQPYSSVYGVSIKEAIEAVYNQVTGRPDVREKASLQRHEHSAGFHRVRYLGGIFQRLFSPPPESLDDTGKDLVVVAKGGIGHIYLNTLMSPGERALFAAQLVKSAHVPLVFALNEKGQVQAGNSNGQYTLPQEAAAVLGENHPYLDAVTADLLALCQHPKAGAFVIFGLTPDGTYTNFVFEHGDHGGPGAIETDAFAVVPEGIRVLSGGRSYVRPRDLRQAALRLLNRGADTPKGEAQQISVRKDTVRVMTYNVHSCIGTDGKISAERVARVISRWGPDIIALQELDLSCPQSALQDQPHIIAKHLQMLYHFHPSIQIEEQQFGNAILSRYPMTLKKAAALPILFKTRKVTKGPVAEPRGALWVQVNVHGRPLQLVTTHLSLFYHEGVKQAQALLGPQWLGHPDCLGPSVICGDFNALPRSPVYHCFKKRLRDVQKEIPGQRPKPTWFSHYPVGRIDHVFVNDGVKVVNVLVADGQLSRMVSDHLPLIVDIKID